MLKINCKKETNRIVNFIRKTFKEKGFTKAVLGISGGLDSAVVCALLVKALGRENVYGLMLPYGKQSDIKDSYLIRDTFLQCWDEVNIKEQADSFLRKKTSKKYKHNLVINPLRFGNIIARVRMITLYDASVLWHCLVVGTGNRTEYLLGYCTLYGDSACAIAPIAHLYKTQVRQLAKYLKIPDKIIKKAPSAGLWKGQTDEKELGMTYEEMDKVLYNIRTFKPLGKKLFWKGVNLINRMNKNKFKRELPRTLC